MIDPNTVFTPQLDQNKFVVESTNYLHGHNTNQVNSSPVEYTVEVFVHDGVKEYKGSGELLSFTFEITDPCYLAELDLSKVIPNQAPSYVLGSTENV